MQAHIDKIHADYIATRSDVDTGFEIHGLFGNILDTDEVEMLDLDIIKKLCSKYFQKEYWCI